MSHPYPEEPNPHVTDPGHGGEDKVHGDDGDQNIVQWKNLKKEEKINQFWTTTLQIQKALVYFSHSPGLQCSSIHLYTTHTFQA